MLLLLLLLLLVICFLLLVRITIATMVIIAVCCANNNKYDQRLLIKQPTNQQTRNCLIRVKSVLGHDKFLAFRCWIFSLCGLSQGSVKQQ